MIVNSLWIQGALNKINHLTIKSFQRHGCDFVIWSYQPLPDADCTVKDARELVPESEIFYYKHHGSLKVYGGFAERVKAEILNQVGGWSVDMDVALLRPIHELDKRDYVLRPHQTWGVVGNVIKSPKNCDLSKRYVDWTKTIDENNYDWEKSFKILYPTIKELGLEQFIMKEVEFGTDAHHHWHDYMKTDRMPPDECYLIHWCAAYGLNEMHPASCLSKLLREYKLD